MDYRTLGQTGLQVSALGFGGAPIGIPDYLSREDRDGAEFQEQAVAAIQEAVARGINYFDTAPAYGDGRSERLLGEALAGLRDRVVLATKFGFRPGQEASAYTVSLEQSLERLGTE